MLDRSEVMAFSATTRPAEALRFYRDVLGLTLVADEEHAIVFDARGTMLRVQKAAHHTPAPHTLLGWRVDDLDATLAGLAERGVRFERYDFLPQDERGVWTTPDGTRIAWFKDPDGNLLSLTRFR
jgi:catechol 2,3-dioxygenase-like lactoylglutathione lyase family enzyme